MRTTLAIILIVALAGCSSPDVRISVSNTTDQNNKPAYDCAAHQSDFSEYSAFFADKDFTRWCQECVELDGLPAASMDAGPFCNMRTDDAGVACTDSRECEGYCIAESSGSTSGKCTEYQQLGDGCGWYEMVSGKPTELCIS